MDSGADFVTLPAGTGKSGLRRQRILATVIEMLKAGQTPQVNSVAARAEVSPGLLYRYWEDFDHLVESAWIEIFAAVMLQDQAVVTQILADQSRSSTEADRQLEMLCHGMFAAGRDSMHWWRLGAAVAGNRAEHHRTEFESARSRVLDAYRDALARHGLFADPRWTAERVEAAVASIAGINLGAVTMMAASPNDEMRRHFGQAAYRAVLGILNLDIN